MAEESKLDVKSIIDRAEISLILDSYDDIFSDFDPRPFNERALSEDFIFETKRAARDKKTGIELRLLIPEKIRSTSDEELIKLRLRSYFKKNYKAAQEELDRRNRRAAVLVSVGAVLGLADAVLLSFNGLGTIFQDAIEIILTPASWYTIWTGFDGLMIKPKETLADRSFYKKMSSAQIIFTTY